MYAVPTGLPLAYSQHLMAGSQRVTPHSVGIGCRPVTLHHPGQLGPGLHRSGRLGLTVRDDDPDRRRRLFRTAKWLLFLRGHWIWFSNGF